MGKSNWLKMKNVNKRPGIGKSKRKACVSNVRLYESKKARRLGGRETKVPGAAKEGRPSSTAASRQNRTYGTVCIHCHNGKINRPRGLCWNCYYAPGIKEMHPPTSKYARRGVEDMEGKVALPDAPTEFAPGTLEKVEVLVQRAEKKQALFHPADARYAGDTGPQEWIKEQSRFVSERCAA